MLNPEMEGPFHREFILGKLLAALTPLNSYFIIWPLKIYMRDFATQNDLSFRPPVLTLPGAGKNNRTGLSPLSN